MKAAKRSIATAPTTDEAYGKWRGDDWTEISEFLGVDIEDKNNDEVIAAETRKRLNELRSDACEMHIGPTLKASSNQKIPEIRRFVEKVIAQEPSDASLWQGLLAIEDDVLFIEYVDRLLECMWT
ncbi:MAG: hypothetical protein O7E52_23675 [Candidatus Poribacteria bacterium]|nr:hypothetical protein [Candidatus Poribacteria bacterium]